MRRWLIVLVAACSSPGPKAPAADDPPTCSGQTPDAQSTTKTPREGAMKLQLSPGFLDQMAPCSSRDAVPHADLVLAAAGYVNAKGDCEWPTGVSCHFHLGAEFVDSRGPRPHVGELHCIFPTNTPSSPRVYGTHFTCKPGTDVPRTHDVHAQAACGANLLPKLASTMDRCDARCCDRGTLTAPTDERRQTGELGLRPDFSVCSATAELDCSMLSTMAGRPAYAPVFGPPVEAGP
jgi:hypothetical protein